ncbi:MAG: hypothetical protein HRT47_01685 [Candidatus Caenarcaniphilales bacterium]|nr:hypothetical protein [Candidatus Caenarcaniphilales bacterium]
MKIPNIRSRNFSLDEVIHYQGEITQEVLLYGMYRMGRLQAIRDYLCLKHDRDIRLKVHSGWRSEWYNSSLPGASDESYHIWRITEKGLLITASDISSPDLNLDQLMEDVAAFTKGETYQHKRFGFVHEADFGRDEEWIVY